MRIGVLGLGFMGWTHIQALAQIPDAKVVAVMSRQESRLAGDLSDSQGNLGTSGGQMDFSNLRKYRDVDTLLADPDIDAVHICLPTHLHAPVTLEALKAGKHVFVEKPMALNDADAEKMTREAAKQKRVLMVAHVLRFMTPYQALTDLVRSGSLGRIRSALFRRRTSVPTWGAWEFDRTKSGGGVFDLLIHDVDIVLQLHGTPDAVSSTGFEDLQGGIDMITSQFHYPNADSVTITGGWHHVGEYPFSMEYTVVADNAVVEYSSSGRPPAIYWKDGRREEIPSPEADPYAAEISYFLDCCRAGKQPDLCLPQESALAVKVANLMVEARNQEGEKVLCQP